MWITDENGYRYAKLVMVTTDNNNKFYEMRQTSPTHYEARWGRVEGHVTTRTFPMEGGTHAWDRKYREKEKKGYQCVTELHAVPTSTSNDTNTIDHDEPIVRSIFQRLQQAATGTIRQNYTATVHSVTQAMLSDAQDKLNVLADCVLSGRFGEFNNQLLLLFTVIPRKMRNVNDHILDLSEKQDAIITQAKSILGEEQELLDTMAGQVHVTHNEKEQPKSGLLGAMGIDVRGITPAERRIIVGLMRDSQFDDSNRFLNAVFVNNRKTSGLFDNFVNGSDNKTTQLLWHGSRTQNWISILNTGLVLYPTNAVITGKMFGYGLYFANRAKKSIGYSSARGSYWAGGTDPQGYIALFDVHMGNPWIIHRHKREYERLKRPDVVAKGYDCVFAKGGYDLVNDEIIVYDQAQCTVRYIVEIR